jgi:hypothetical protein
MRCSRSLGPKGIASMRAAVPDGVLKRVCRTIVPSR